MEYRKLREKANQAKEQRMDDAAEYWIQTILPNWGKSSYENKAKDLVRKVGIPPRVRARIWPLCLGNSLMITEDLYNIFRHQAKEARAAHVKAVQEDPDHAYRDDTTVGKAKTFTYVDQDLSRTFPALAFFQEGCPMNTDLRELLDTYCFYRPDMGYVQGMSYLAGNLLLYMAPFTAFVCFCNLLRAPFFHAFFKTDQALMAERYSIINSLLKLNVPDLFKHLTREDVGPQLYFLEWAMTLFAKRMQLDLVGRVWDCYLVNGEEYVYRTTIALLKVRPSQLLFSTFLFWVTSLLIYLIYSCFSGEQTNAARKAYGRIDTIDSRTSSKGR